MSLWILIPLAVWLLGFAVFMCAIIFEAPKQQSPIMVTHIVVALGWPIWLIWYAWAVLDDWRNKR